MRQTVVSRTEAPVILRTGADGPVDPEDLAMADGEDPVEPYLERHRRRLAELGPRVAVETSTP
ncbi:hypothetical protein C3Y87_09975 [Carbonactinospora thermoautotrophica]|uniref:Uncharacterized protein n=1 Tax=Carbonactinospora thermoautotrophica TaxID=1469144 RepID=A0A132N6T1_9ACTN|nr:hypothetical protein [Carbonactinospora thermoautotrophica]KWW99059.1 hypothetical protein LI90_691 [Carbonactinospora thermoautotrophica]KWX05119.1 hypothetical protein TH66_05200 [Carbonactinospora thermoautotrophica]KWX05829.1 hypothetical protein TR74_23540 [Carbonactinospora thermoautotrophica]MCX9191737.1 hypothetical protein [Carbonactinospora thermoautotrophica]